MSEWIRFVNGPLAQQMWEVKRAEDQYFALKEPDPFQAFDQATNVVPGPDTLAQRITYHPIADTRNPRLYMTQDFDRPIEILNFIKSLGFTLTWDQERLIRHWFREDKQQHGQSH